MNTGGDYTTHHSNENVIGPEMHDSNGDDEDDLESQYSGFLDTYTKLLPHQYVLSTEYTRSMSFIVSHIVHIQRSPTLQSNF